MGKTVGYLIPVVLFLFSGIIANAQCGTSRGADYDGGFASSTSSDRCGPQIIPVIGSGVFRNKRLLANRMFPAQNEVNFFSITNLQFAWSFDIPIVNDDKRVGFINKLERRSHL